MLHAFEVGVDGAGLRDQRVRLRDVRAHEDIEIRPEILSIKDTTGDIFWVVGVVGSSP